MTNGRKLAEVSWIWCENNDLQLGYRRYLLEPECDIIEMQTYTVAIIFIYSIKIKYWSAAVMDLHWLCGLKVKVACAEKAFLYT